MSQAAHQPAAHHRRHDRAPVQEEGAEGLRPAREELAAFLGRSGLPYPLQRLGQASLVLRRRVGRQLTVPGGRIASAL
jgi:hypothetical protein